MSQDVHPTPGLGSGLVHALRNTNCLESGPESGPLAVSLKLCKSEVENLAEAHVQLSVCLENTSGKPIFLDLGTIAGNASDAAVLAAAGLQCEIVDAERGNRWQSAKVLEPRAVPGGQPVASRCQVLYLPPRQGTRIPLVGVALNSAMSFGGSSGDDAEVLLPLPQDNTEGVLRCRVRFELNHARACIEDEHGAGRNTNEYKAACSWVGPFAAPGSMPHDELRWHGHIVSQVVAFPLRPAFGAHTPNDGALLPTPMPRAPKWPRPGRIYQRKLRGKLVAPKHQQARHRQQSALRPRTADWGKAAASTVGSLLGDVIEDLANTANRKASSQIGSRGSARSGLDSAPSSGLAAQDLDFVPSSASSSATVATRLSGCTQMLQDLVDESQPSPQEAVNTESGDSQDQRLGRLPRICQDKLDSTSSLSVVRRLDCAAGWRSTRKDPLSDPILLELAEIINGMRSQYSTIVICTKRLKTRVGQRFISALRSAGFRIFPAQELRMLSTWASAPRAFQCVEELVLVADWHELFACFGVLRQAFDASFTEFRVLGAVALCEPREEAQAKALVEARLPCSCRVLPNLAC